MKLGTAFTLLLVMFMSVDAAAETPADGGFPYGLLELRGYTMEMNRDGKFRIYSDAMTFVEGTFATDGYKITFTDTGGEFACRGEGMNPGSYYWTVHDHGLYLMLIRDDCAARRTAFLEGPLKTD